MQPPFLVLSKDCKQNLYNDIDPLEAELWASSLVKHGMKSSMVPAAHLACDIQAPKLFLATENDKALPLERQLPMAEAAGAKIERIPFGHSPFLRKDGIERIMKAISDLS